MEKLVTETIEVEGVEVVAPGNPEGIDEWVEIHLLADKDLRWVLDGNTEEGSQEALRHALGAWLEVHVDSPGVGAKITAGSDASIERFVAVMKIVEDVGIETVTIAEPVENERLGDPVPD